MPLSIKICGLKTPQALDVALDSGANLVGFVFFPPSPRHIGFEAARTLGQRVQGRAVKVALTVDANDEMLRDIVNALNPSRIIVGGEITAAWDLVEDEIRAGISERSLTDRAGATPIIPEVASRHPRLRGATALVAGPIFAAPQLA